MIDDGRGVLWTVLAAAAAIAAAIAMEEEEEAAYIGRGAKGEQEKMILERNCA